MNKKVSVLLSGVLLVGTLAVGCSDTSNQQQETPQKEQPQETPQQQEDTIKGYSSGMYKVGENFEEGEYVLIKNDGEYMGSFDITLGTSGDFEEMIESDAFSNFEYIVAKDGWYIQLDKCVAYKKDEANLNYSDYSELTNGMFIVGQDVEEGEYVLEAIDKESQGWYTINNSLDGGYNDGRQLQTADFFDNNTLITLRNGQYLKLDDNTKLIK